MDQKVLRDLLEYVVAFLGVLFLALGESFGINIPDVWLEVFTKGGVAAIVGYTIYHNKHVTPKGQKQRKVLEANNLK